MSSGFNSFIRTFPNGKQYSLLFIQFFKVFVSSDKTRILSFQRILKSNFYYIEIDLSFKEDSI